MLYIYDDLEELSEYINTIKPHTYILFVLNENIPDESFLSFQYKNTPAILIEMLSTLLEGLYQEMPKDD